MRSRRDRGPYGAFIPCICDTGLRDVIPPGSFFHTNHRTGDWGLVTADWLLAPVFPVFQHHSVEEHAGQEVGAPGGEMDVI